MITIRQDAELMTNLLPANPVPAGNRFAVFKDEHSDPALFSLSEDHRLNLVLRMHGSLKLVDFSEHAGIADKKTDVTAFNVQQAPDGTLDIAVTTDAESNQSEFWLIHGIRPQELLEDIPASKMIKATGFPKVFYIFMSNLRTDTTSPYPLIFVAFQPVDRITKEEQLGYVEISTASDGSVTVAINKDWRLATNPKQILDVSFGTCALGDGVFVLYKAYSGDTDKLKLQFKIFRGSTFTVEPKCPDGATSLASFIDPDTGYSVLLVGGDVITAFKQVDYTSSKRFGTTIATGDASLGIKDIHAAQSSEDLRIWYTTLADAVHYYETKTSTLSDGRLVPLLPDGKGGQVSSMLTARDVHGTSAGVVSTILSVDEQGHVFLLQQDSRSHLWQVYPFYRASATNTIPVRGYTLRIQAVASDGTEDDENNIDDDDDPLYRTLPPVQCCWLWVRSSGFISCLVNGKPDILSPAGGWYQADMEGVLTVIFPTLDASCHRVFVDCYRAAEAPRLPPQQRPIQVLDTPPLDPSGKVVERLSAIHSGQDLLSATTQSNQRLLGPDVTADEADKAAKAIEILVKQRSKVGERDEKHSADFKAMIKSKLQHDRTVVQFDVAPDLIDTVMDAGQEVWNWVKERAADVEEWVCETVEVIVDEATNAVKTVVRIIVTIGNEVYTFIVDSIASIAEAISFVFRKIGVLVEKLIEFVGFIFNWDDILDTTDSLVTYLNVGLDYGQALLDNLDADIKVQLETLRSDVKEAITTIAASDQTDVKVETSSSDTSANDATDQDKNIVEGGVGYHWVTYQLTHGGFVTDATVTKPSSADDSADRLLAGLWDDIKQQVDIAEGFTTALVNDFIKSFQSSSVDLKALLAKITADTVDAAIDTLKNLSDIFAKVFSLAIESIKNLGNYAVECPVFSALWKLIAKGRPLTLFNLCCFLAAIPTTVLYKTLFGKALPKLQGRLTKAVFEEYVTTGTIQSDLDLAADLRIFSRAGVIGLALLSRQVVLISLVVGGVLEGVGLDFLAVRQQYAHPTRRLALPGWVENVIDCVNLGFDVGVAILTWPAKAMRRPEMEWIDLLRWGAWLIEGCNTVALVLTRAYGYVYDIPRVVTKRVRGTVAAFTSVLIFPMELAVAFNDYVNPVDRAQSVGVWSRHAGSAVLKLVGFWGFAFAAWFDEIEDPVMWAGLAVFGSTTAARGYLMVLDLKDAGALRSIVLHDRSSATDGNVHYIHTSRC